MTEGPAGVVLEVPAVNEGPPVPAPTVTPGPVVVDDAGVFVVPVDCKSCVCVCRARFV